MSVITVLNNREYLRESPWLLFSSFILASGLASEMVPLLSNRWYDDRACSRYHHTHSYIPNVRTDLYDVWDDFFFFYFKAEERVKADPPQTEAVLCLFATFCVLPVLISLHVVFICPPPSICMFTLLSAAVFFFLLSVHASVFPLMITGKCCKCYLYKHSHIFHKISRCFLLNSSPNILCWEYKCVSSGEVKLTFPICLAK